MTKGTLDWETKVTMVAREGKIHIDMGPYHPENFLVSGGLKTDDEPTDYLWFQHSDIPPTEGAVETTQKWLDSLDLLICHNSKYELSWMKAIGLKYEGKVFCTQIAEYVLARGVKKSFKLKECLDRRKLPSKRTDLIDQYMKDGVTFDLIPAEVVEEYGIADVDCTKALYDDQMPELVDSGLLATVEMMCEFTKVLVEMESNGAVIDFNALDIVEREYRAEYVQISTRMQELAATAMGDTPVRLTSPDFKSQLLFSRSINDKKQWKTEFNIGTDEAGRKKRRRSLRKHELNGAISSMTSVVRKTKATQCSSCIGTGEYWKVKKDGTPWARPTKCPTCVGVGILYESTGQVAGFKLKARNVHDLSANGFSTDKELLQDFLDMDLSDDAREFLTLNIRFNAISVYLASFIGGFKRYAQDDNILHTSLNQTITATGRLSSSSPNFQNQPRGGTFPIKRAIVSRFKGGKIFEADYEQLEFRAAGIMSGDSVILSDVTNGMDVHSFTRDTINGHSTTLHPIDRQGAKSDTFKPLYGGMSGSKAQVEYYKAFLEKYSETADWQEELKNEAIKYKYITLPTGRQYAFPNAERKPGGYVTDTTKIVNYPVQGFATGDLAPLGIIATYRLFKKHKLRSLLFLTVHDSVEADCYPGEEEIVSKCMSDGLLALPEMLKEFYNINMEWKMPMGIEIKGGPNWLDTEFVGVWDRVGSEPIRKVK